MTKQQLKPELVFYSGTELKGFKCDNGEYISPEQMLQIYISYENKLKCENFLEARLDESYGNYPKTWLNRVLYEIITNNRNGLAKKLVFEFKDRGYDESWLKG